MTTKPRIKVPEAIKAGDIIEIKTLIAHVMETGLRRDQDGKAVPRNIINAFSVTFEGKDVFKAALQPGISANPYMAFFMKVPGPGELQFTWKDDAGVVVTEKLKLDVVA